MPTPEQNAQKIARMTDRSVKSRKQAKEIKAALKDGRVPLYDFVAGRCEPLEPIIATWTLDRLLRQLPGVGQDRRFEILATFGGDHGVKPSRQIALLTPEQRE